MLGIVAAAVLLAAPVAAQQQGPEDPTLAEVDPARARAGDTVEVRGSGWEPGEQIEVAYQGRPVSFATTGADGTWETQVTVPDVEAPATAQLEVSGVSATGEETTLRITLEVAAGIRPGVWVVIGVVAAVVLIVVIIGAAMLMRRPRPTLRQRMAEGETPVRNPDPREEPQPHDDRR